MAARVQEQWSEGDISMKSATRRSIYLAGAGLACVMLATGCATKKHVRNTIAPLEQRVGANESKLAKHDSALEELSAGVSRADERALGAQGTADRALKDAAMANAAAAKASEASLEAGNRAIEARQLAEMGMARAKGVDARLEAALGSLENYKEIASASVLFPFNKAELDAEARAQLDQAVKATAGKKHFVIEVRGYTDKTGAKDYNLALSEKRADAVVRYLTTVHGVPLRRIYRIGNGDEAPAADNKTREGRKLNRRVELKVLAFDIAEPAQTAAAY
jgi:OOP family OmpA-OmpF porin